MNARGPVPQLHSAMARRRVGGKRMLRDSALKGGEAPLAPFLRSSASRLLRLKMMKPEKAARSHGSVVAMYPADSSMWANGEMMG